MSLKLQMYMEIIYLQYSKFDIKILFFISSIFYVLYSIHICIYSGKYIVWNSKEINLNHRSSLKKNREIFTRKASSKNIHDSLRIQ